ncbi:MAG: DNA repair protein RadA [Spirochaetales bacterium]|nr:DNA repair protein RadA [Spirochaetales bacterium]
MAKEKTIYICSECDNTEQNWLGRCPQCGKWNSFVESKITAKESGRSFRGDQREKRGVNLPQNLLKLKVEQELRYSSGISEMDKVLGGGIMRGGSTLIGGEPGIGKSTLLLQIISNSGAKKALYVSGEESAGQIKLRAERLELNLEKITVLCETRINKLIQIVTKEKYDLIVIDSIQTVVSEDAGPVAGTVNQIKYCSMELVDTTRYLGASLFLIGHVTKEGSLAGPKQIEHLVDTVLYFDQTETGVRIVRAVKNRFGSVDEIGVFTMTEKGLQPAVHPESFFLEKRETDNSGDIPAGVAAAAVFEGSRTFMVEIQALTVPAKSGYTRVYSDRVDTAKISRIAAILEKHIGLGFSDQDIYINVAGGIRLIEVGIELPLALALYSARTGKPLEKRLASAGELSLAGEVRRIGHLDKRVHTVGQMGFKRFLGPTTQNFHSASDVANKIYTSCTNIHEAVQFIFSDSPTAAN